METAACSRDVIRFTCVIVGGGIAGVSCAEQLSLEDPEIDILLISSSPLIKAVKNFKQISRTLEEFDIGEESYKVLEERFNNVHVICDTVVSLNSENNELCTSAGRIIIYKKLCLCSGAVPKVILKNSPYVIGIRDTETIQVFQEKLTNAKRILIVGNGGIATELAYEIEKCQVVWVIKDKSIGSTFFDAGAAEFFLPELKKDKTAKVSVLKRLKYAVGEASEPVKLEHMGSALGPDWSSDIAFEGSGNELHQVHIEYDCEIKAIFTSEEFALTHFRATEIGGTSKDHWPIYAVLTNGSVFGCDFVISATGVEPNIHPFVPGNAFIIAQDGGLEVDSQMRTSIKDIYAAGDICSAAWVLAKHWIQMRLWTQAHQMGAFAGKSIIAHLRGEELTQDICFELFTHVTKFFGYKVVLLGLFNGQKLGRDYEILLRMTKDEEYVKVILQEGKMQGAILIGETDLEETFENLILDYLDLSSYGENLLNPNIDIEDYFD